MRLERLSVDSLERLLQKDGLHLKGAFVDSRDGLLQKDWPQSLGCRGFRLMSVHVIERKYRQKHVEVACWVYRVGFSCRSDRKAPKLMRPTASIKLSRTC